MALLRLPGGAPRTPAIVISLLVVALAVVVAVAAPWLGLPDPDAMEAIPYQPPNARHWFGTDNFGRDVLSRIVWGTRLALIVAVVSSLASSILGIVLGSISGYFGGWVDGVMSRTFDVFLLIPTFFLVLLIVALFGQGLQYTMIAIALTTWPLRRGGLLSRRSPRVSAGSTRTRRVRFACCRRRTNCSP